VFLPEVDGPDLRLRPGDADPATLDVAVVPGLGFALDGRRLGQGGGHFDRFLPRLRPACLTIGVCFAEQLLEDLPTERHDVRVHAVVTDANPPAAPPDAR
jgi:5-formyltetrahydrofolate cyclo-ligase